MKGRFIFLLCLSALQPVAQTDKLAKLPEELAEVSGLTFYNDSLLLAHNDSGNSPVLYFLRTDGSLVHSLQVDVPNTDWEDITTDGQGRIFIGDIGNNANTRKDLSVYVVNDPEILERDSVHAERIAFSYPEQSTFPPADTALYYDAESLVWHDEQLFIFTKCRRKPYDGRSLVYTIPDRPGTYSAQLITSFTTDGKNFFSSLTAADIHDDTLYLLSYTHVYLYEFRKNQLVFLKKQGVGRFSQLESLAVSASGKIYLGDEYHRLIGGRNLYLFTWKKD